MPRGSVGQDSSEAGRGCAAGYEMTVSVRIVVVRGRLLVVRQTHVMAQLMAETEITKGAVLCGDGDGQANADGVQVSHPAAAEVH